MNVARIAVLAVAIGAGGLAAVLAGRSDPPPAPVAQPAKSIDTTAVLVAGADIAMGDRIKAGALSWQEWPSASASAAFIRRKDRPEALSELEGAIARQPILNGEPIRDAKLIKSDGSGFMAAILPSGMRAVSTPVSPETGAGGFILPNDHVDVILTRRDRVAERSTGTETMVSEMILPNIRVLAIDQTIGEKDGQKVVVGRTATLELSPDQVETLALSQQLGTLSLALRSLVDTDRSKTEPVASTNRKGGVNMVRFGVQTVSPPVN